MQQAVRPNIGYNAMNVVDILLGGSGTILEFGSGYSSQYLVSKGYEVYAVEHNPKWQNRFPGVRYINTPIVPFPENIPRSFRKRFEQTTWYDFNVIQEAIKGLKFDMMIVDGPPKSIGRAGIFLYRDKLDWSIPVYWDNTDRPTEMKIVQFIAQGAGQRFSLNINNYGKWYSCLTSSNRDDLTRVIEELPNEDN